MSEVLRFENVSVVRDGKSILDGVSWSVDEADRWVILGPNGAGKSTLLMLAAGFMHPTRGKVTVLGEQLGRTDVTELRTRVGLAASRQSQLLPGNETVLNCVVTASYGVSGRWREEYDEIDLAQAHAVLEAWQLDGLADRKFGTLSDGERKRTLIARAVMADPELLLLDEPSASLDLGAREALLASLREYAASELSPGIIMVTHHVEEIPVGVTHALLLRDGKVVAAGPLADTLTSQNLTATFGLPLQVMVQSGRYSARAS